MNLIKYEGIKDMPFTFIRDCYDLLTQLNTYNNSLFDLPNDATVDWLNKVLENTVWLLVDLSRVAALAITKDDGHGNPNIIKHNTKSVLAISHLFVSPDYRRKGLASRLLNAIHEEAKASNRIVQLNVVSVNYGAIKLYTKLGYEHVPVRTPWYLFKIRDILRLGVRIHHEEAKIVDKKYIEYKNKKYMYQLSELPLTYWLFNVDSMQCWVALTEAISNEYPTAVNILMNRRKSRAIDSIEMPHIMQYDPS